MILGSRKLSGENFRGQYLHFLCCPLCLAARLGPKIHAG